MEPMTTLQIADELRDSLRGLTRREDDALVETGVLEDVNGEPSTCGIEVPLADLFAFAHGES